MQGIFNLVLLSCIVIKPVYRQTLKEVISSPPEKWYHTITVYPKEDVHPVDSTLFYTGFAGGDTFFVFIRAYQRVKIAASILKDDQEDILNDDWVLIVLDTQGKGNTGYAFQANPIGTKRDFILSEGGDKFVEWDGNWDVKVMRTRYGYNMMFIIPLSSMTYVKHAWGLRIERFIANRGELQAICNTGSFQSLSGIAQIDVDFNKISKEKRTLYGYIAKFQTLPSFYIRAYKNWESGKPSFYSLMYGGNIRLKKGNSTLLDLTLYPDFSDIEADIMEIPLNRKPIYYPEKRPFFMEGRDLLLTPVNLIRTRNFNDLKGGIKFYTKTPSMSTILFIVQDAFFDTISFGKVTLTPIRNYSVGFQYIFSPSSYKFLTSDASFPISKKHNVGVKLQATHREDTVSTLLFGEIYKRSEFQGLDMSLQFMHLDKNFLTPLSNLYFDDINEAFIKIAYGKPIGKEASVKPEINYFVDKSASGDTLVDKYISATFTISRNEIGLSFIFQKESMPYLNVDLEDKTYTYLGGYLEYTISSYQSVSLTVLKGRNLGFESYSISAKVKTTPFHIFNLGFKFDRISYESASGIPSEALYQLFGIISIHRFNFILKPYIGIHEVGEQNLLFTKQIAYVNLSESLKLFGVYMYNIRKLNGNLLSKSADYTIKVVYNF